LAPHPSHELCLVAGRCGTRAHGSRQRPAWLIGMPMVSDQRVTLGLV